MNANNDGWDIMIGNITRKYGNANVTRDLLKSTLLSIFYTNGWVHKYKEVQNIRIPYAQDDDNNINFYGFISMKDPSCHPELLIELRSKPILFSSQPLEFKPADRTK
jgi:hypothetical protein